MTSACRGGVVCLDLILPLWGQVNKSLEHPLALALVDGRLFNKDVPNGRTRQVSGHAEGFAADERGSRLLPEVKVFIWINVHHPL